METPTRKEQIVHAALEVLGEQGSKGLTHRAVDSAAGVPPGSVVVFMSSHCSFGALVVPSPQTPPLGRLMGAVQVALQAGQVAWP